MKKYLCSLVCMLCILCSAVIASAEQAEWKATNYDFNKIEKIYIDDNILIDDDDIELSDLSALKIRQSLEENQKYIKKYRIVHNKDLADAILSVKLLNWGTHEYWVEPKVVTETKTISHTDKNGKTSSISIPVTTTEPGYSYYTQSFSAKFELVDKQGKTIFERIDTREDTKRTYDMFNRASKDFYKDVNSLK